MAASYLIELSQIPDNYFNFFHSSNKTQKKKTHANSKHPATVTQGRFYKVRRSFLFVLGPHKIPLQPFQKIGAISLMFLPGYTLDIGFQHG